MAHLYIIAGHGAGDPGACGNGYQEAERVRALAQRIKDFGGDGVTLHPFADNAYASKAIDRLMIPKDWQICELHMDSASATARGGHVLIKPGFAPDDYDKALSSFISDMFPGRAETLRNQQLGNATRAAARGFGYRLLECCFISNAADVERFNACMDDLARGILGCFGIAAGDAPVQTPNPPAESAPAPSTGGFEGGTYRCTVNDLRVRAAPSLSGAVVASYDMGQTVVLDGWYTVADGWVWGRYTGASSGQKRYVAVCRATGKPESDDFLVKV